MAFITETPAGERFLQKQSTPADLRQINTLPLGAFKNRIINGCFRMWQRGTSQIDSAGYASADRWRVHRAGAGYTLSRQAFTIGQSAVPGNPDYFSRHVISSVTGASNLAACAQRIEGVGNSSNKTLTLTFWAKADANKQLAVEGSQSFGTGGSSDVVGISAAKLSLTTAWQKFTCTLAFPSISGKTVGAGSYYAVWFWFDAGSSWDTRTATLGHQSGTFDIAQVQLEEGAVATPFEQRPIGVEEMLCRRYYSVVLVGQRMMVSGVVSYARISFPVPMYGIPAISSITITGNNGGTATKYLTSMGVEIVNSTTAVADLNSLAADAEL